MTKQNTAFYSEATLREESVAEVWTKHTETDRLSVPPRGTDFNEESKKDLGRCTKQLPLTAQMRRGLLVSRSLLISCDIFNPSSMDLDRRLTVSPSS